MPVPMVTTMFEFRVQYDPRTDVLYISTDRNGPAYAREGDDGIVWRYLESDHSLVGVTVMDFDAYWKDHMSDLTSQMSAHFHIPERRAKRALALAHG